MKESELIYEFRKYKNTLFSFYYYPSNITKYDLDSNHKDGLHFDDNDFFKYFKKIDNKIINNPLQFINNTKERKIYIVCLMDDCTANNLFVYSSEIGKYVLPWDCIDECIFTLSGDICSMHEEDNEDECADDVNTLLEDFRDDGYFF